MKRDVLTIGGATQDIFIEYPCTDLLTFQSVTAPRSFVLLEEGKKLIIDTLSYKTGGGATNSAVSFVRQGFSTAIFCKLGTDDAATAIIAELDQYTIDHEAVVTTAQIHTGTSFIIPCPSGNRAVLVYRGANLLMQEAEIPFATFAHTRMLYITSLSGQTASLLKNITHKAHTAGCLVAANPGTSQLAAGPQLIVPALAHIDIFILNQYEATLLAQTLVPQQPFDMIRTLHEISAHGPKTVVITYGADGVYALHDGVVWYHPSITVPVMSTLGAGDAFGSGFVGTLMHTQSIEDALRCGVINSASVLAHADCKAGLLTREQLAQKLKALDKNLLQKR